MANGDGSEALQEAEAMFAVLMEFMRDFYGPEAVQEIERVASKTDQFLSAPQTAEMQIEDVISRAANEGGGLSAQQIEALRRHLPRLFALRKTVAPIARRDEPLLQTPAGKSFLAMLDSARGTLGDGKYEEVIEPIRALGIKDISSPAVASVLQDPEAVSFELSTRVTSDAIRRAAEGWYKPMLSCALRLWYLERGEENKSIQSDVGALLVQCRDVWSNNGGPTGVVDDRVRIVRNSESHHQTEIEPRGETVLFINRPRNRPEERLGPWNREQFGAFAKSFYDNCLTMWLAILVKG